MESEIIIVLVILGLTVVMMVLDLVRIDIVAITCMLAHGWTGILDSEEMFSGFSSDSHA
jgi:di/tricarboxylate transporter